MIVYLNGWEGGFEGTLYPTLITISASVGCIISAPLSVEFLKLTRGNLRYACVCLDVMGVVSVLI